MNVTMVTSAQRWIAIVLLAAAAVTALLRVVTGVPALLEAGMSLDTVLGWVFLGGLLVLTALWIGWAVRLLRGTVARVAVVGPGLVRTEQPWASTDVHGVTPHGVTVHSFLRWQWVRLTGSRVVVKEAVLPNVRHRNLAVAGPARNAEQVADWLRRSLT